MATAPASAVLGSLRITGPSAGLTSGADAPAATGQPPGGPRRRRLGSLHGRRDHGGEPNPSKASVPHVPDTPGGAAGFAPAEKKQKGARVCPAPHQHTRAHENPR